MRVFAEDAEYQFHAMHVDVWKRITCWQRMKQEQYERWGNKNHSESGGSNTRWLGLLVAQTR
jgi:hypothetical protein